RLIDFDRFGGLLTYTRQTFAVSVSQSLPFFQENEHESASMVHLRIDSILRLRPGTGGREGSRGKGRGRAHGGRQVREVRFVEPPRGPLKAPHARRAARPAEPVAVYGEQHVRKRVANRDRSTVEDVVLAGDR